MPIIELILVVLLILVNGVLAMAEMAVVSSRRSRIEQMREAGRPGAEAALALLADPTRFLSTVQIGITMVGVLAGAFGGATLGDHLAAALEGLGLEPATAATVAISSVVVTITFLSLVIGELVPKRIALTAPEAIALRVAPMMRVLASIGHPAVWVLRHATDLVLRLLRVTASDGPKVTDDELRALLAEGRETGVFAETEAEMIDSLVRIADRPVRSLMTPRPDMVWLDTKAEQAEWAATLAQSGHTRFPVCRGDPDDIVGVLHVRDLTAALLAGGGPVDLAALARQPLMIHEGTSVIRLVEMWRTLPVHLAMVLDEYGSVEGLVTPTDLLNAIAGGRLDDGDQPEAIVREDKSWLVDGRMEVHRVERLLGVRGMATDHYATLAGFILNTLRRLPRVAESFEWQGWRFEIVDLDGRRIDKVLIGPVQSAAAAPAD